jgi:hypothetical protein
MGHKLGASGDRQFRIYVQLKPEALQILQRSNEFKRGPDNTVYHKGYPICYRSTGGTPSIQVSLSRDATQADIDVDYRSSKFPVFLVNGHLSASNSDVRAGNNDVRHNSQWAGFQNWWSNLLGLSLQEEDTPQSSKDERRMILENPKVKHNKPADAIFDFLNGWLVEKKPNEAIAYFAHEAYACMEVEAGKSIDRGMAKFNVLRAMISTAQGVGKVAALTDVSTSVTFTDERLKSIRHEHEPAFTLYEVREDLAEQFRCLNKLDSTQISSKALRSKDYGKYVVTIVRLGPKNRTGETVAMLWEKQGGYWRMISYSLEPDNDQRGVPNLEQREKSQAGSSYVAGDGDMITAATEFLNQWLVKKNIRKALAYLAPECHACVGLYRDEDEPPPKTQAAVDRLKEGMTRAATALDADKTLDSAISAPEVHHDHVKLVKHPNESAFVIASIPEYMAVALDCARRKPGEDPGFTPAEPGGYGKYYATGFSRNGGSAALWMVWGRVNGHWKVISYALIQP